MKSISKSKYISGIKCPKLLWYEYNAKDEIPAVDAATAARFAEGHKIGDWAKQLYPGGIEVAYNPDSYAAMIKETKELLPRRIPIFEATLEHNGAFARADVLVPVGEDEWDMIEVKSSTKVKDYHYDDLAVQAYIFRGEGIKLRKCMLAHVDTGYIRQGDIDPEQLLKQEDLTEAVEKKLAGVADKLKEMQAIVKRKSCPDTKISQHCDMFYACQMKDVCRKFLPRQSVLLLTRGKRKAYELIADGVLEITDIPEGFALSEKQLIQVAAIRSGEPYVNKREIAEFLAGLEYPLYFLDFETSNPAVPLHDGTCPYQMIPFQYSLHVLAEAGGKPTHYSFLAEGRADPREEILANLKELLGAQGTMLAYNAGFELARLREMTAAYPDYQDWFAGIAARTVDLWAPFRSYCYYHPDQLGSASMKCILPLFDKQGYKDMPIADGGTASSEYMRVTFGEAAVEDRQQVRKDLEVYCALDTAGMITILDGLRKLVK